MGEHGARGLLRGVAHLRSAARAQELHQLRGDLRLDVLLRLADLRAAHLRNGPVVLRLEVLAAGRHHGLRALLAETSAQDGA